jgi:hypothetical protein
MDEIPALPIPQMTTILDTREASYLTSYQEFFHFKLFNSFSNKVLSFQLSFNPNLQHKHILALIVQKNPNLPEIFYNLTCLRVWLRLLFKILFMLKCIKMMFFYFLKIIYKIIASKRSKTYKKINF